MVKHIILWKIKEEYTGSEKENIKLGVKEGLEALKGVVPGLVDIHVQTESLESSTADLMRKVIPSPRWESQYAV